MCTRTSPDARHAQSPLTITAHGQRAAPFLTSSNLPLPSGHVLPTFATLESQSSLFHREAEVVPAADVPAAASVSREVLVAAPVLAAALAEVLVLVDVPAAAPVLAADVPVAVPWL